MDGYNSTANLITGGILFGAALIDPAAGEAGGTGATSVDLQAAFQDLSQFRSELGGIPAAGGLIPDGGALAVLNTEGGPIYGMNASGQPWLIGSAFNYGHAEVDALQQAFMAGQLDSNMTMFVDQELCRYCRRIDGLPSCVSDLGMNGLTVHDPVNSWLVTPSGTSLIPRP